MIYFPLHSLTIPPFPESDQPVASASINLNLVKKESINLNPSGISNSVASGLSPVGFSPVGLSPVGLSPVGLSIGRGSFSLAYKKNSLIPQLSLSAFSSKVDVNSIVTEEPVWSASSL